LFTELLAGGEKPRLSVIQVGSGIGRVSGTRKPFGSCQERAVGLIKVDGWCKLFKNRFGPVIWEKNAWRVTVRTVGVDGCHGWSRNQSEKRVAR
jgi:hypothetical protein